MKYKEDFLEETIAFYKKALDNIRSFKLSNNKKGITHQNIVPFATYSPWHDDPQFLKTFEICKENTLVDIYRCYELWNYIKRNNYLEGDALEVGVWKGGTGCIIAKALEQFSEGKVYLADTFEGVVKAGVKDTVYKGGEHSDTTEQIVNELILKNELDNTVIMKGVFPDEINFEKLNLENIKLRMCHIDVDTYESAKDIFYNVWPLIVKGGAVIFDDYGFWGCEGITILVNELEIKDASVIHNLNGHGIFIKL